MQQTTHSSCAQRHVHTHQENILMELFHTVTVGFHFTVQFSSAAQLCPTLCDSHGLQHARLLCPAPTLGDRVGDAIQPSQTLSSPSPAFNLPQHQGHFTFTSVIFKVCIFAYLAHHENVLKGNWNKQKELVCCLTLRFLKELLNNKLKGNSGHRNVNYKLYTNF